jgi:hypothetical protein
VRSRLLLLPVLVSAAVAAASLGADRADSAAKACAPHGYAYAGLQAPASAYGVSATLTSVVTPVVQGGHVAAWIGVGAPGEGPNGSDEWLQIGQNMIAGSSSKLYYEIAQPWGIRYVELEQQADPGVPAHVAVLEMAGRRSVWRVWLNGRPVSNPIWLPGSHGHLTPMAMAENWDGGASVCNRYSYSFHGAELASTPGGSWVRFRMRNADVLQDPGFRIVPAATGGFVAATAAGSASRLPLAVHHRAVR